MSHDFEITEKCTFPENHPFYNILEGMWQQLYDAQEFAKRPDVIKASQVRKREILRRQGCLWLNTQDNNNIYCLVCNCSKLFWHF